MTGDLDLSPPEVPESSLFERILRYGLFLGAIFQIICILAIIVPTGKSPEQVETTSPVTHESRVSEPSKKPKAAAQQTRQKLKKESKKKR